MCWTEMTTRVNPVGLVKAAGSDGVWLTVRHIIPQSPGQLYNVWWEYVILRPLFP
jgi:hypothetical protein